MNNGLIELRNKIKKLSSPDIAKFRNGFLKQQKENMEKAMFLQD
jgi:hypothetical protein